MALNPEYLVLKRSNAKTRNGSDFATLTLKNEQEEITVSVWDLTPTTPPQQGDLVCFHAIRNEDGRRSARAADIVSSTVKKCTEEHPFYAFLPHPIAKEEWTRCVNQLLSYCSDDTLKGIISDFAEKLYDPYSKWPAATSIHHAFPGGLLNHTYQMLHMFEGLYPTLPYKVNPDYIALAVLFHDYGKVYEYDQQGKRQPLAFLKGHIYISAHKLENVLAQKQVKQEDIDRIVHIVLAHHGELEFGSPVLPCTQEAVLVNYLDNISAKLDNIDGTPDGDKSYALGTNVVK